VEEPNGLQAVVRRREAIAITFKEIENFIV
jgi:hypothetical protein